MTCIQKSEVPPWDFFSLTRLTGPSVGGLDFLVKMSQNVHFFTVLHLYCVFLMSLHFLRLAVEMLTTTCIWRSNFTRYIFQKKKNKKYKHFRALLFSNGHRQPKHAHKERLQISNWRFAKLKQNSELKLHIGQTFLQVIVDFQDKSKLYQNWKLSCLRYEGATPTSQELSSFMPTRH